VSGLSGSKPKKGTLAPPDKLSNHILCYILPIQTSTHKRNARSLQKVSSTCKCHGYLLTDHKTHLARRQPIVEHLATSNRTP